MEQSIVGQQVMAEGPQASAEAAGMAGGQSAAQPAMGQQSQGGGCDCEETTSNPEPQPAQPAGQAESMGQAMAAPGQQADGMTGGTNPQMGQSQGGGCDCEETASNPQPQPAQPAGQAVNMGQPMAAPGQQTVGMNPQMGVTMEQQPSALGAAAQAYGASPVTQNPGVMPDAGMNPQPAQPAGQAVNMGQPMAAPGQQTVGMNPQMGVTMEQQPSALGAAAQAYGASPVTQNPGVMPGAGMNPQPAQPAGQAVNMGQPMAAPGQQTVGMNPQMSQPAAQAVGMGQQQAMYDPNQYAAWQAWYQQQAAQAANAAAMASQAAGPGGVAADGRAHHPKFEEHKYGQMIDMVGKFLNGEANVGEVVNGLFSLNFQDDQFWKGALVGAVAALLLTNETVQSGLTKTVGSVFATAQSGAEKVSKTYKEATEEVKKEKK